MSSNNANRGRGGGGGRRGGGMIPAPASASAAPSPPTLNGPVDLSSFLAGMAEESVADASAVGGVVRGRARENQATVKEHEPTSTKAEVEDKLKKHITQVLAKAPAAATPAAAAAAAASETIPATTLNRARVSLASGACLPATAIGLVKEDASSRVLVVTSLEEAVNCKTSKEVVAAGLADKVGYWAGARREPEAPVPIASVRVWYTTFRAVISFLSNFYHQDGSAAACPFTHVFVVARDGRFTPLFDTAVSIIATLMLTAPSFKNTRLVLCGVSAQSDVEKLLAAPALAAADGEQNAKLLSLVEGDAASFQSLNKKAEHQPLLVSPSEAAALAGTSVKEHAPSAVSLRRLPGTVHSLPQVLVDHGVTVAVAVLARTVQMAAAAKLPGALRVAIVGAELNDIARAIDAHLPANTFTVFQDVQQFLAAASAAAASTTTTLILVANRAVSDHVAAQLQLHAVLDCGTERRAQIPPQGEMHFPIRALLQPSRREVAARQSMAGWRAEGPGIYVSTIGSTTTASAVAASDAAGAAASATPDVEEEEDLLEPVCDAVLALAQSGIDLVHMMRQERRGRATQLQLALPYLEELGCIVKGGPNGGPATTFIGEIATRCGLAPEFASIVLHGLVCGLPDAAAFVATAAARPFRLSARDTISRPTAGGDGFEVFGDTIEDAVVLAECAAAVASSSSSSGGASKLEQVAAFCEAKKQKSGGATQLHAESLESALNIVSVVQRGIDDFVIPTATTASSGANKAEAVRRQIAENANLFVVFVCAALARRAVVVRHEGTENINTPSRGNLLFTHTAKEMLANRFVRTCVNWKKDLVVLCSAVLNTPNRLLGSGATAVSNDFFMGSLLALAPLVGCSSYNDGAGGSGNKAMLSVALNQLEKTTLVPRAVADQLLQLRERWGTLLSYVQLRRATGTKTAAAFKDAVFKHMDKRFVLEKAQSEFVAELCELVADFHVDVPLTIQASAHGHHHHHHHRGGRNNNGNNVGPGPRTMSLLGAPAPPATLTAIAPASDFALAKEVALMLLAPGDAAASKKAEEANNKSATATSAAAAAAAAAAASAAKADSDAEEEEGVIIDDE